jgi:hypothetical protein
MIWPYLVVGLLFSFHDRFRDFTRLILQSAQQKLDLLERQHEMFGCLLFFVLILVARAGFLVE